jgi:hypothetical protein
MATTFTSHHGHTASSGITSEAAANPKNALAIFLHDLIEDVGQKPLQSAALAKHDMFREHISAMTISYFALILLLLVVSLPILAYFIQY